MNIFSRSLACAAVLTLTLVGTEAFAQKRISNKLSGLSLDAHRPDVGRNDCRIQLWSDFGLANQRWNFTNLGNGYYKITNAASGNAGSFC